MLLTEILKPECVKVPLRATDKKAAIFELVDLLEDVGLVRDCDALKSAVWAREQTRTTGIGHGLAIPTARATASRASRWPSDARRSRWSSPPSTSAPCA